LRKSRDLPKATLADGSEGGTQGVPHGYLVRVCVIAIFGRYESLVYLIVSPGQNDGELVMDDTQGSDRCGEIIVLLCQPVKLRE
jgi:hypothetical protein